MLHKIIKIIRNRFNGSVFVIQKYDFIIFHIKTNDIPIIVYRERDIFVREIVSVPLKKTSKPSPQKLFF